MATEGVSIARDELKKMGAMQVALFLSSDVAQAKDEEDQTLRVVRWVEAIREAGVPEVQESRKGRVRAIVEASRELCGCLSCSGAHAIPPDNPRMPVSCGFPQILNHLLMWEGQS